MTRDLQELGESVSARAEKARNIAKRLHEKGWDSVESEQRKAAASAKEHDVNSGDDAPTEPRDCDETGETIDNDKLPLPEEQLVTEFCAMARHASRATGRAPLNPPEFVRDQRLEDVREAVQEAQKKRDPTRS